uniref:Uncharacterized protein n=1 Tax=Panagrolaimus sp. JU765 TaxID=591449 RepID=A0AC34Q2V3_9BILA
MRVPKGAPTTGWFKLQQRFPTLKAISRPTLGTIAVISTCIITVFAVYAVGIQPKINNEYYKNVQKEARSKMHASREELANGLRPWSDPFERK